MSRNMKLSASFKLDVKGTASGNCASGFGFETVTSILHTTASLLTTVVRRITRGRGIE